jgi:hypothetical protein
MNNILDELFDGEPVETEDGLILDLVPDAEAPAEEEED